MLIYLIQPKGPHLLREHLADPILWMLIPPHFGHMFDVTVSHAVWWVLYFRDLDCLIVDVFLLSRYRNPGVVGPILRSLEPPHSGYKFTSR